MTSATAGAGVTRAQVPSARDVDGMEALPAVPVAFAFLWRRTIHVGFQWAWLFPLRKRAPLGQLSLPFPKKRRA